MNFLAYRNFRCFNIFAGNNIIFAALSVYDTVQKYLSKYPHGSYKDDTYR